MKFLMSEVRCRPHAARDRNECEFRVEWAINPHMNPNAAQGVDIDKAERQHDLLRRALIELGADVTTVPFVHGAYDSVFIKDNAILVEEHGAYRALLAQPRFAEREREQHAREHALEAMGIEIVDEATAPLEGGDVALLPEGRGALLGWGPRSSIESVEALETFLDVEVTPLELRDPRLYHLDTALAVLRDGSVLACKEAFTEASWRVLTLTRGVRRIIEVPVEEALAFGLNFIEYDGAVLLSRGADATAERLKELGLEPVSLPLDELHKAGGSVSCLVAQVHEAPVAALLRRHRPQASHVEG